MTARDCPHFDACNAPLCPLDPGSTAGVWFADEPVCARTEVPDWVKRQRKIGRVADYSAGMFTLEMLNHPGRVSRGIRGIDPELPVEKIPAAVEKWKAAHPAITDERRAQLRAQLPKNNPELRAKNEENASLYGAISGVPGKSGPHTPLNAGGPGNPLSEVQS